MQRFSEKFNVRYIFFPLAKSLDHEIESKCTNVSLDPFFRWHYDSSEGVCHEFTYAGKKGNGNRFLTRQDCESSCQPSQDVCELPKTVGPCNGREVQFWYDKEKDECFTFDWGECNETKTKRMKVNLKK